MSCGEIRLQPQFRVAYHAVLLSLGDCQRACVQTFDVSELPVRCAKFISRKQLIITGKFARRSRVIAGGAPGPLNDSTARC